MEASDATDSSVRNHAGVSDQVQTKRSSRSMDGPPQGSGALKNVPHRPIPGGRLFEVTHSASLNRGKPEVRVLLVRYSVCLIATTAGSRAACCRNCTTMSK